MVSDLIELKSCLVLAMLLCSVPGWAGFHLANLLTDLMGILCLGLDSLDSPLTS